MGPRIKLTILIFALGLVPGMAMAEPPEDYWKRSGWYVGLNGLYGLPFMGDAIEDAIGVSTDVGSSGGLNFYGGYRVNSWFAVDAAYEWMDNMTWNVGGVKFDYALHNWTANAKFILPMWRVQPYINLGIGAQYADLGLQGFDIDETAWAFVGRPGIGIDFWLTENLVLKTEANGMLATNALSNPAGRVNNLYYMSVGGGFQYRF